MENVESTKAILIDRKKKSNNHYVFLKILAALTFVKPNIFNQAHRDKTISQKDAYENAFILSDIHSNTHENIDIHKYRLENI